MSPQHAPQTADEFRVLHGIRIRGAVSDRALEEMTALSPDRVSAALRDLEEAGRAELLCGRMRGWRLTPSGRAYHAERIAEEAAVRRSTQHQAAMELWYEGFSELNASFKEICCDWQVKDGLMNAHTDRAYDEMVLDRLRKVHAVALQLVDEAAREVGRMAPYAPRLSAAMARIDRGDVDAVAKPLTSSYHDVWMELHEDVILTLGLKRTDADA